MLTKADRVVQEAVELVKTSQAAHLVFACIFMSHDAIEEICDAFPSDAQQDRSLSFVCLYFGTQPAL